MMRIVTITIFSINVAELIFLISIPFIWSDQYDGRMETNIVGIDVAVMCLALAFAYIAVIIYLIRPLNKLSERGEKFNK